MKIFFSLLAAVLVFFLFRDFWQCRHPEPIPKPAISDQAMVNIFVNKYLGSAEMQNQRIPVKKNEIIVIDDRNESLFKVFLPFFTWDETIITLESAKKIPIRDIISLKVPGRSEKFYLADQSPTIIKAEADGYLEFSLDYPEFLSSFFTARRTIDNRKFREAVLIPIGISVKRSIKPIGNPPRQFVRLGGILGEVFPDYKTENKLPDKNLSDALTELAPTVKGKYTKEEAE